MTIEFLRVENFRNFKFLELEFSLGINLIQGENAAGKTSLLEALHFLARAKSFRTSKKQQLIRKNSDSFTLFSQINSLEYANIPLGIGYLDKKIQVRLDNQAVTRLSQLAKILPIQTLSGNLHQIIEEGPNFRRQFIDWALFHVKHRYIDGWRRYRKSLQQRNAGLRKGSSDTELGYWENALITDGELLNHQRIEYLNLLQKPFQEILFSLLTDEIICRLEYQTGWPKNNTHLEALVNERANDREKGYTRYGPHRSDIAFKGSDGSNIFPLLSRGQQKLFVISLQLAHIQYLNNQLGIQSHFLLDDLGAELDVNHQNKVIQQIGNMDVQAFITTLDKKEYDLASDKTQVFHVEHDHVNKVL